ncbi:MAG: hypothetical protein QGH60_23590 [Phycisphaerae bacterium]|jgi:hypothetical protein|nr:hypothetical protein [Phycisphaerae bacterium]
MPAKNTTKSHHEACLETLKGLQTLVEMQQMLILQAIGQLGLPAGALQKPKSRSARSLSDFASRLTPV